MSYDDWKCSPPEPSGAELPDIDDLDGEEPTTFTCDCGASLDPTLDVSMCRACFDSCSPTKK